MMAHNLCYTTLVDKRTIDELGLIKDDDYILTPNNGSFSTLPRDVKERRDADLTSSFEQTSS